LGLFKGLPMNYFYRLQIFYLSIFQPSKLFERINRLPWYQGLLHEWIADVEIAPQSRLLEIGSATGVLSEYLFSQYEVTSGVDNAPKMIAKAKENYPHIDFQVADASSLPFKDEAFSVVVASSLINLVEERQEILNEMLRVCKRDGKVLLLFPLEGFSDDALLQVSSDLGLKGFSQMALKMWHKMAKKMSVATVEDLLKESDFEILSTKEYLSGMVGTVVIGGIDE